MGISDSPARRIAIEEVLTDATVDGPAPEFADRVRELHAKRMGLI